MSKVKLTENDKKLIKEAEGLHYIDWSLIDPSRADTEEGKNKLNNTMVKLYHKEQFSARLL